ncbi:unnamed protein product, partial [Meganyctiphanes norvegica]
NNPRNREERETAQGFYQSLEPIDKEFSGLDAIELIDAEDVLDTTQNSLDDLWNKDFPQQRMNHLLNILSNHIARYVQGKLNEENLWGGPYSQIEKSLSEGINVCERWVESC